MDTSGATPRPDPEQSVAGGPDAAAPDPTAVPIPSAPAPAAGDTSRLFGALALYSLLRVGLVAVLTAALSFFMPLIVALMFAIIIQLPLAWLLFKGPRARVNDAIATASARRRAERSRLQAGLSGEPV